MLGVVELVVSVMVLEMAPVGVGVVVLAGDAPLSFRQAPGCSRINEGCSAP